MYDSIVDNDVVVVGVDQTPYSRAALEWAARSAAAAGRSLLICHVEPGTHGAAGTADAAELLDEALKAARRTLSAERVQVCLCRGDPAAALARLASPAKLLVLGGAAEPALSWSGRGSMALQAAMVARCPLVVVRADGGMPGPLRGQVVAAVDGSVAARAALQFAFAHAEAHELPLAAAYVSEEPGRGYWFDERLLETHFVTEPPALGFLQQETEPWRHRYPRVPVKLVVLGGPRVEALTMASQGASLLAIGRVEAGAPEAPLGPVAYGLLRAAGCPVAVLRPAGADNRAVPTGSGRRAAGDGGGFVAAGS